MAICEQCGKEHDGSFGSGRFCSRSCSNKWVALHQSDEAKARKIEKGKGNLTNAGKGWNLTKEQNKHYARMGAAAAASVKRERRRLWLIEVFEGKIDPWDGSYRTLRDCLITFGYKERVCEVCGNREWLGEPIPLELHHKDGDRKKNELDNLQLLCPNCHSLTDNYGWKKHNTRKID